MTLIFYECCIGILFLVDVSEYSAYCRKLQEDEKNIIFRRDVAFYRDKACLVSITKVYSVFNDFTGFITAALMAW